MDLIRQLHEQEKYARAAVENYNILKETAEEPSKKQYVEDFKKAALETLLLAETANDPDTPTMAKRKEGRDATLTLAKNMISLYKKQINSNKKLTDSERRHIADSTIICADMCAALTAKTNKERKVIYNRNFDDRIAAVTHGNVLFQIDDTTVINVLFYDEISNDEELFKQFIKGDDEVKKQLLQDHIEIVSILANTKKGSQNITHAFLVEDLPRKVYEIANLSRA